MCGIIGYTGLENAVDVLLDCLSDLSYRGYDSAGISIFHAGQLFTAKTKGRITDLAALCKTTGFPSGTSGIGHTRWATHGEPSTQNAHPHCTDKLSLVHNGIIENYRPIKEFLLRKGYSFSSDTDTECAAKLLDFFYQGNPIEAINSLQKQLEGSYAFGILFADHPEKVYAVRRGSPLIAAKSKAGTFIASDIPAVLKYTKTFCPLDDGEIAELDKDSVRFYSKDGIPIKKAFQTAQWNITQAQKDGFPHYMLKEIYEQPKVLLQTIRPRIIDNLPDFSAEKIPPGFWNAFDFIHIVACGTAMHAGMIGKTLIESLARIPVETQIASEFRYEKPILSKRHLVIIISQSGETADSLAALRLSKQLDAVTLAIVNVAGSSIEREADYSIQTYAGPEIAVASTKAFSTQVAILYLIAIQMALSRASIPQKTAVELTDELQIAIQKTPETLLLNDEIQKQAILLKQQKDLFFLGRGLDYMLGMEGSLKLKEISYIHCEAYAAGELKHGTISLITPHVPVIALATQEDVLSKMINNIREARSRGADVILFCKKGFVIDPDVYTQKLELPSLPDLFMPLIGIIPLQLLAYHTAVLRGCDVDKPRNLAKSVTVE